MIVTGTATWSTVVCWCCHWSWLSWTVPVGRLSIPWVSEVLCNCIWLDKVGRLDLCPLNIIWWTHDSFRQNFAFNCVHLCSWLSLLHKGAVFISVFLVFFPLHSAQTVGVIVRLEKENFQVLNMHGKLVHVKPQAVHKKKENRRAMALDSEQSTIQVKDIVKVIDGPHSVSPRKKCFTLQSMSSLM